jgi:tRNA(Ile)-lysidine synthase
MCDRRLSDAVQSLPPGAYAVGVSGGADSVALLSLLRRCPDLQLHVVHLDHQTRGEESTADARFVAELATKWNLPATLALRQQIEPLLPDPPSNLSARFRALRMKLFAQVVAERNLSGVILAHHADDQAETVLHRLLRGSGYEGLCGMSPAARLGSLRVLRPLLGIRRAELRAWLTSTDQPWREDSSNFSDKYLRNRLRAFLLDRPQLTADLLTLCSACRALRDWARANAPRFGETLPADQLANLPPLLARQAAGAWLISRGASAQALTPKSVDRLLAMAADAASPSRADFPGALHIRRRRGLLFVDPDGCNPPPTQTRS